METRHEREIVGNIGLYHVCRELSRRGLKISLTRRGWKSISRNVRGVDIIATDKNSQKEFTIQIIAVLNSEPVPFGNSIKNLSDCVVLCRSGKSDEQTENDLIPMPEIFILTKQNIIESITKKTNGDKTNHWLDKSAYELQKDEWEKIYSI